MLGTISNLMLRNLPCFLYIKKQSCYAIPFFHSMSWFIWTKKLLLGLKPSQSFFPHGAIHWMPFLCITFAQSKSQEMYLCT